MDRRDDDRVRRFLRGVLAERRAQVRRLAGWSVVEAAPGLSSGLFVAAALDRGFLAGRPVTGVLLLGGYALAALLGAVGTRNAVPHVAAIVELMRDRLVDTVVRGELNRCVYGDGTSVRGRIDSAAVARIAQHVEFVRMASAGMLTSVRAVVLGSVATLIGLLLLDPVLAALAAPALAASLWLLARLSPLLRRRYEDVLHAQEETARRCERTVHGLRDVVVLGASGTAAGQLDRAAARQAEATMAGAVAGAGRVAVVVVGARLPLAAVLVAAPWLLSSGSLSAGALVGAVVYLIHGLEPALRAFVHVVGTMGLQLVVTLRGLLAGTDSAAGPRGGSRLVGAIDIAVDSVTVRHGTSSRPVLSSLTLDIAPGEHLAVVGPSGVGKSTLARVLAGVDQPQQGDVRVGGIRVPDLQELSLRQTVALVPQESYVFAGTVLDNLTYLHPAVTRVRLDAAVDDLGMKDLVERLGGYGGRIERPGALSQGERQLITLARVYVSRARVVVLDEVTSGLDPVAEARVEEAFARRPGTLVVVAHRISSAARADRVVMLEGDAVRSGTHTDLVRCSPRYAELVGRWLSAVR